MRPLQRNWHGVALRPITVGSRHVLLRLPLGRAYHAKSDTGTRTVCGKPLIGAEFSTMRYAEDGCSNCSVRLPRLRTTTCLICDKKQTEITMAGRPRNTCKVGDCTRLRKNRMMKAWRDKERQEKARRKQALLDEVRQSR